MRHHSAATSHRRGGYVLVIALVAISVCSTLVAGLLRTMLLERQSVQRTERRLQLDALWRAGWSRGSAALAANEQYTGETWKVAAEQLDGRSAAEVVIRVLPAEGTMGQRLAVDVVYPAGTRRPGLRKSETMPWENVNESSNPKS